MLWSRAVVGYIVAGDIEYLLNLNVQYSDNCVCQCNQLTPCFS